MTNFPTTLKTFSPQKYSIIVESAVVLYNMSQSSQPFSSIIFSFRTSIEEKHAQRPLVRWKLQRRLLGDAVRHSLAHMVATGTRAASVGEDINRRDLWSPMFRKPGDKIAHG